jgi:hypothetical protein
MGRSSFRGGTVHAAVILVLVSVFAAAAVTAKATTTTSSSGSATCTTFPGSCTFSGNGSATFQGQFDTPAVLVDPSLCFPQAADPEDTLCGHFGINTSNVQGTITVTISFDPVNDLDLCVVNALDTVVDCSTGFGASETVTFAVSCTDTHFEAQIVPFSYPFPGPTPLDPATYTGSVTATLTACTGGGGPPPPTPSAAHGHKVTGGGQTATGMSPDANVSLNVIEETSGTTPAYKGKVRIASAGCDFRSTEIDTVVWNDAIMAAEIDGKGMLNDSTAVVDFVAHAKDNGERSSQIVADRFTIDKCSGGGNVVSGNIQYHLPGS